jgi:hypothetical protein
MTIAWQLLNVVVTLVALYGFSAKVNPQKKAQLLKGGSIEFAPQESAKWCWALSTAGLASFTLSQLPVSDIRPLHLLTTSALAALAVIFLFSFPHSIVVSADGLHQTAWLRRTKAHSLGRYR